MCKCANRHRNIIIKGSCLLKIFSILWPGPNLYRHGNAATLNEKIKPASFCNSAYNINVIIYLLHSLFLYICYQHINPATIIKQHIHLGSILINLYCTIKKQHLQKTLIFEPLSKKLKLHFIINKYN